MFWKLPSQSSSDISIGYSSYITPLITTLFPGPNTSIKITPKNVSIEATEAASSVKIFRNPSVFKNVRYSDREVASAKLFFSYALYKAYNITTLHTHAHMTYNYNIKHTHTHVNSKASVFAEVFAPLSLFLVSVATFPYSAYFCDVLCHVFSRTCPRKHHTFCTINLGRVLFFIIIVMVLSHNV